MQGRLAGEKLLDLARLTKCLTIQGHFERASEEEMSKEDLLKGRFECSVYIWRRKTEQGEFDDEFDFHFKHPVDQPVRLAVVMVTKSQVLNCTVWAIS